MINMRFYRVIDYTRLNGIKGTSHCLNTMWIWISHGFTGHRPMMNWLGASNMFLVFQPCKSDVWLRWLDDIYIYIFLGRVKNHQPVNQLNMIQHVRKIVFFLQEEPATVECSCFWGFGSAGWELKFWNSGYPLVNIQKTMERSTIFHGKTHYFILFRLGHFQVRKQLVYQRVEDGETYHAFWMWLSLPRIAFPNSVSCSDCRVSRLG